MEAGTRSAGRYPAPLCPECGSSMVMRTARRGGNIGNRFWGCSTFPKCRGIVAVGDQARSNSGATASGGAGEERGGDVEPASTEVEGLRADGSKEETGTGAFRRRMDWADGTFNRQGWTARHASAGGSLRSLPDARAEHLGCCWVARENRGPGQAGGGPSPLSGAVGSMLRLLARGTSPPMHPDAENLLVKANDGEFAAALGVPGFLGSR